jgi:hypothetical protein
MFGAKLFWATITRSSSFFKIQTITTRIVYKKGFQNRKLQGLYIKKDFKTENYKDCI